jgi:hypothetical protein
MSNLTCLVAIGGAALLAGGCLVVSGHHVEETGTRVSSSSLAQVELGATTEEWLLATFGPPTDRSAVDGGGPDRVEIFKYRHRITRSEGGAVFLIFAGGSTKEETNTTYFELVNGVVRRCWSE